MNKIIALVGVCRGRPEGVKATHVVAGVEVLETLAFLRHMAHAARRVPTDTQPF